MTKPNQSRVRAAHKKINIKKQKPASNLIRASRRVLLKPSELITRIDGWRFSHSQRRWMLFALTRHAMFAQVVGEFLRVLRLLCLLPVHSPMI